MSKISVITRLKSANSLLATIYVKHSHKQSPFAKSTGIEIHPSHLLKSGKVSNKLTEAPEYNRIIQDVYSDIEKAARNIIGWGGEPDRAAMAKEYLAITKNRIKADEGIPTILKKIDSVIASLQADLLAAKEHVKRIEGEIMEWELINGSYEGKLFSNAILDYAKEIRLTKSKSTSSSYKSIAKDFRLFNPSLKFEHISVTVLEDYEKYLIERGITNESIKTYVAKIKTVYKYYAAKFQMLPSLLETHKMQTKLLKNKDIIYFTTSELQALTALELPQSSDKVRDLMLLMCHTGLRYSDARLTKDNIIGGYIILTTKKTSTHIKIPLSQTAKTILEKYDYQIPKYKLTYFNRVIKEICERIPSMLTDITSKPTKTGVHVSENIMVRYAAITSKVGRKTFATHSLAAGVNPAVLKSWLGHSKLEMMLNHYASGQHNTISEMDKLGASLL